MIATMHSCDNQRSANTPDVHNNTRAHSRVLAALIVFSFTSNLNGKFLWLKRIHLLGQMNTNRALCPLMQHEGDIQCDLVLM